MSDLSLLLRAPGRIHVRVIKLHDAESAATVPTTRGLLKAQTAETPSREAARVRAGQQPVSWIKRTRRAFRAGIILAALHVMSLLPFRLACSLGRAGGAAASLLLLRERWRTMHHLEMAFPDMTDRDRRRITRRNFEHLGQCVAECAQLWRIRQQIESTVCLPAAAAQVLHEAMGEQKGAVVVSAHLGNWELLPQRLAREGYVVSVVARELNSPALNRAVEQCRAHNGIRTIWRGSPAAMRDMLRVFRDNGLLGLLIDQDTKVRSVFVPFFGRPASTPGAAGDLVARTGAPLLAPFIHRRADGRHVIQIRRLTITPTGDAEQDSRLFTAAATQAIEQAIRQNPEQWVWLHRRWRTQPDGQSNDAKVPIQPDRE
jgi:Kdo2-lipid IVA lauroyltransferase/acyltransferase